MPRVLSTTALKDAATCLRRYQYAHVDKIIPKPSDLAPRIRKGIWLHYALALADKGVRWQQALIECRRWAVEHGVPEDAADAMLAECARILDGYHAYWATQPQWRHEVLTVEESMLYAIPGTGITLRATVDKVIKWRGMTWVWERKSTEHIPTESWRAIDPQTALQAVLCEASGRFDRIDGYIFDYLVTRDPIIPRVKNDGRLYSQSESASTTSQAFEQCIPEIHARWAHGPGCNLDASLAHGAACVAPYIQTMRAQVVRDGLFYQRYEVFRPVSALRESVRDAAGLARNLMAAEQAGYYPRSISLLTCPRFCPYSNLCASEYVSGQVNHAMRSYEFIPDDPNDREGR